MNNAEDWCQRALNYQFSDPSLLHRALTHRSASPLNNERLEFLGDAVLDLVISRALFDGMPSVREYGLTRYRAELVRKETLVEVAGSIDLAPWIIVSSGENQSGLRHRDSVLGNAVEAIIGAIFLDGGYSAARQVILSLFHERLGNLPDEEALKDPKTRLQEYLQGRKMPLPEYALVEIDGPDHAHTVAVTCRLSRLGIETTASDTSRRRAEQAAAARALEAIADV